MPRRPNPAVAALLAAAAIPISARPLQAQCVSLMPIGGSGQPAVEKRISANRLVGRTNWNTDFTVNQNFGSYRVNLRSASSGRGTFPVSVFLRFTDGTNLQLAQQNLTLEPGQEHQLGPFPAVAGKRTSQVNVRVGAGNMPGSTGFSYRLFVEGCR